MFYPLNLLLAQETDRPTFRERTEQFLRNWICVSKGTGNGRLGEGHARVSGAPILGAPAQAACPLEA